MARWITVHRPFDYHWPGQSAVTAFRDADEYFVKDEVADFAVERGHATEGKLKGSTKRSSKGTTARPKRAKAAPKGTAAAKTADSRSDDPVAGAHLADDDRPAGGDGVDPDAG